VTPNVFQFIGQSNDSRRHGRGTYFIIIFYLFVFFCTALPPGNFELTAIFCYYFYLYYLGLYLSGGRDRAHDIFLVLAPSMSLGGQSNKRVSTLCYATSGNQPSFNKVARADEGQGQTCHPRPSATALPKSKKERHIFLRHISPSRNYGNDQYW
jgi:hypothetical protein